MGERIISLAMIYALVALLLIARLFTLQVMQGEDHAAAVQDSREQVELLQAKRGRLLDRNGVAIVDNRAIYRAGVVLSDLELPWRVRRRLAYYELGEAAFDAFLADLAIRLSRDHEELRTVVLNEWQANPTIAFRRGAEPRDTSLTLLALPASVLLPLAEANDRTAELAMSGLVVADPREALRREIAARWNEQAWVFTPEEFALTTAAIEAKSAMGADRCYTVLKAFAPKVTATIGVGSQATLLELHVLTAERRRQAENALVRFLSLSAADVHQRMDAALSAGRLDSRDRGVYFAAQIDAFEVAALLPPSSAMYPVAFRGVPPARERIILIQGDRQGVTNDAFTRGCRGLAATLGLSADAIAGLIEQHAVRSTIISAERIYRHKLVAVDVDAMDKLTVGLSRLLVQSGLAATPLDIERSVADARRIADREWAGQGHHDPVAIVEEIPHQVAQALDGRGAIVPRELQRRYDATDPELPGFRIIIDSGREYPYAETLCHAIGGLGRVDHQFSHDNALELRLDPEGHLGRSGLERLYDDYLRGEVGRRIWRHTTDGVELIHERSAEPGRDLVLEVDLEIQQQAEKSLDTWFELAGQLNVATAKMDKSRAIGKGRAGMCVIDCNTGGILALASAPRYRPDERSQRWEELLADPREPLHDHAAEASQPPGSALKILTSFAALEMGELTPYETITTKGYMAMVNGRPVLRSHAPPGVYDLIEAIAQSDNCYFATVGQRVGPQRLSDYFSNYGMGRNNALDVPQQRGGVLPHPSTLGRHWGNGDTWRFAIGQFNTASPLQVVTIAAAAANGGHIVTPYFVRPPGGPVVRDLNIRAEYLQQVRRGMEAVTGGEHGTAKYLQLGGDLKSIDIAAKTGTSEWGNTDPERFPDHAWLIGYAPADKPAIAFAIFIHSGTSGGRACSGVAKAVLEAYFNKYGPGGHAQSRPVNQMGAGQP